MRLTILGNGGGISDGLPYNAFVLDGRLLVEVPPDQQPEGFPGLVNSMRLDGFKCALEGHDNFEIVASQVADWTRAKGQEVTENLLTAHPDIQFLFGLYDEMSLGATTRRGVAARSSSNTFCPFATSGNRCS